MMFSTGGVRVYFRVFRVLISNYNTLKRNLTKIIVEEKYAPKQLQYQVYVRHGETNTLNTHFPVRANF